MEKSWQDRRGLRGRAQINRKKQEPFGRRAARFLKAAATVIVVVTALPAIAYAGWKTYGFVITTEHLAITDIEITGAAMVSEDLALGLLGIEPGKNIFSFKAAAAAENLKKNPWVESVAVRRRIPGTVRVEITERTPVALVKTDALYVMDAKGVLFKRSVPDEDLDLPVVTGMTDGLAGAAPRLTNGLLDLIKMLSERPGFSLRMVSEISIDPVYGFSVYTLKEGVRLALGSGGFEEKLAAFERVVAARGGSLRGIEAMDLKNKTEVIVRFITNVVKGGGAA